MRIASLSPAATELLFAWGLGEAVVCRDQFSLFPDAAKGLPWVRGHVDIPVEELRPYAPDIVLTGTSIQATLAQRLRSAGMTVVHLDPRTLRAVEESFVHLGTVLDREQKAQATVMAFRQALNDVRKKAALLPRKPRVYVEEWHDPPMASGNWVPELIRTAGGEPFPIAPGELSRTVTLEEVAAFNPDLVVISWCGAGALADRELLLRRPGWEALPAAVAGRVRVIDDSLLNRPGPRLPEGARRVYGWLFEMLH